MKIGLLDHQLTNYHIKKFHSLLTGPLSEGVTLTAATENTPTDQGKAWCTENKVPYAATADEIISASDAIIVLAPNNPEKHLEIATPALRSGKPVFIDKMLAQTPEDARDLVKIAKDSGAPIMSSSSLRFASELEELDKRIEGRPIDAVFARGLGKFPIYAVHTLTMALRYFGPKLERVIDTGEPGTRLLTLDNGERRASVEVRESENPYEATPWQVGIRVGGKYEVATVKDFDGFYENLMRRALEFFRTGKSPISTEEQIATVRAQAAAEQSIANGGVWIEASKA